MKYLIFTLVLLLCLTSYAQQVPDTGFANKAEAKNLMVNGEKDGKWIEYLNNSMQDTKDTPAFYYRLIEYNAGKPHGIVHEYFGKGEAAGKIRNRIPYADGKKNGVATKYYYIGKCASVCTYKDGKIDGLETDYTNTGKITREINFVDGKKSRQKDYSANEKLVSETNYDGDKKNGLEKLY